MQGRLNGGSQPHIVERIASLDRGTGGGGARGRRGDACVRRHGRRHYSGGLDTARRPRRIRRSKQADALMVEREQRGEMRQRGRLREHEMAIVQDEPAAAIADRQHRMVLLDRTVADQQQPQVGGRHARRAQDHVFGDRIVLAVAAARCQRRQRRGPEVGDAVLRIVARCSGSRN